MTLLLAAVLIFGGNISDPITGHDARRETGGLNGASAGQSRVLDTAAVSPESETGANERTPAAGVVTRLNGHVKTPSPSSVVPAGIWVAGVMAGNISDPAWAIKGDANFADPSHGSGYLAMRLPRGTRVTICAVHCQTMTVSDYGPAKRTGDIADIALVRFARICGYTIPEARRRGECEVVVTGAARLPATDEAEPYHSVSFQVAV